MLKVSPETMLAMEADRAQRKSFRFSNWRHAHQDTLGYLDQFSSTRLFEALQDELEITGLKEEIQQFLFVVARERMPQMNSEQYLQVMDIIVADCDDFNKLAMINKIAELTNHG